MLPGKDSPQLLFWSLLGLRGVVYVGFIARRLPLQTTYRAVFEDRLFHVLLPLTAYAMLAAGACTACFHPRLALFLAGAVALILLFIGIHNAWDIIRYHVFEKKQKETETDAQR